MPGLTAADVIDVWDRCHAATPVRRALALLAAGSPQDDEPALAALAVGTRDTRLLDLREGTFGPRLACQPVCPGCGETLESTFEVADIRIEPDRPQGPFHLDLDGYSLDVRLPDSTDLLAIERTANPDTARAILLDRCAQRCTHAGAPIDWRRAPERVIAAATDRMQELDPQANTRVGFVCPACGNQWVETFDIVSFFWTEIAACARRLLLEVHTIASAYGWREAEILAMSAFRRQAYLEMVGR
jgi:hypothetical protein